MTNEMRASAREMRHMVGRYLHAFGCPGYAVNAVRDAIVAAQAEGFDAVTEMELVRESYPSASTTFDVQRDGDRIVLSGRGTPALILAPALIDELVLAVDAQIEEVRIVDAPGLDVVVSLADYAAVRGIAFDVQLLVGDQASGDDDAILTPRRVEKTPALPAESSAGAAMRRVLLEGYVMDADQFWRLFHESNEALTPDSELSRRHAGSQLYDEEGNLLGEVGEETYQHLRRDEDDSAQAVLA